MADAPVFTGLYRILIWLSFVGIVLVLVLVLRKSTPPNVPYDPTAASRVQQKFADADQAKAAGQQPQVALDRTELNSYLQRNLQLEGSAPGANAPVPAPSVSGANTGNTSPADGAPSADPTSGLAGGDQPTLEQVQSSVKDVKVDMDGDLVKAYVVFDFHGKDMSLELDGHLGTENGYMKFEPVSGQLGSMPLPQSMLNSVVDKMMASPENREKLKLPDDVNDIQIVNGQAVVSYK
ncbi:MAG: hypothetical protein ABR953_02080 [Candidatus Acidiferrales bacterium]|jgi:hypothetical protein